MIRVEWVEGGYWKVKDVENETEAAKLVFEKLMVSDKVRVIRI